MRDALTDKERQRLQRLSRKNLDPMQREIDSLGWTTTRWRTTKRHYREELWVKGEKNKVRVFVLRTKPYEHGLEIHIYEFGNEIGVTNTGNDDFSEAAVFQMAHEYVEISEWCADDESYQLLISQEPVT